MRRPACLFLVFAGACVADTSPLPLQAQIEGGPPSHVPRVWLLDASSGDIAWGDEGGVQLVATAPAAFVRTETFDGGRAGAFARYSNDRDGEPNASLFVDRGFTSYRVAPEAGLRFGVASPDGQRVVVEHDGAAAIYEVTTGALEPIPEVDVEDVVWSPTSHAVAFGDEAALRLVFADGDHADYDASGEAAAPFWDPNGEQVAFGRQVLSIVGRDGALETIAVPADHWLFEVKWAATGDAFVYKLLVPGAAWGDFCVAQRIGDHFESIFCDGNPVDGYAISDDGRTVVYAPRYLEQIRVFSLRTRTSFRVDTPDSIHLYLPNVEVVGDTFVAAGANGFVMIDPSGKVLDQLDRVPRIRWTELDPTARRVAVDDGGDLRAFSRSGHVDRFSLGGAAQHAWTRDGQWIVLRHGTTVRALEIDSGRLHIYEGAWSAFSLFDGRG